MVLRTQSIICQPDEEAAPLKWLHADMEPVMEFLRNEERMGRYMPLVTL